MDYLLYLLNRFFKFFERMCLIILFSLPFVPFGIWKFIEIIIWTIHHLKIEIK